MTRTIHPFEQSEMGLAPYTFTNCYRLSTPGKCAHCGTKIQWACEIEDACGMDWVVGTDCIKKVSQETGDASDILIAANFNRARKLAEDVEWDVRQAAAVAWFTEDETRLTDQAHPKGWRGKSLRDDTEYLLRSGNTNVQKAVVRIEKARAGTLSDVVDKNTVARRTMPVRTSAYKPVRSLSYWNAGEEQADYEMERRAALAEDGIFD